MKSLSQKSQLEILSRTEEETESEKSGSDQDLQSLISIDPDKNDIFDTIDRRMIYWILEHKKAENDSRVFSYLLKNPPQKPKASEIIAYLDDISDATDPRMIDWILEHKKAENKSDVLSYLMNNPPQKPEETEIKVYMDESKNSDQESRKAIDLRGVEADEIRKTVEQTMNDYDSLEKMFEEMENSKKHYSQPNSLLIRESDSFVARDPILKVLPMEVASDTTSSSSYSSGQTSVMSESFIDDAKPQFTCSIDEEDLKCKTHDMESEKTEIITDKTMIASLLEGDTKSYKVGDLTKTNNGDYCDPSCQELITDETMIESLREDKGLLKSIGSGLASKEVIKSKPSSSISKVKSSNLFLDIFKGIFSLIK